MSQSAFKRFKEKIRPRWVRTLRQWAQSRVRLEKVRRHFGLAPIDGNPLAGIKNSDTLFILGSGASINDLSEAEWETIRGADTLGFNFWLVNDFVPSVYVFECLHEGDPDCACLVANLAARRDDYAGVPMILKDGERHRPEVLSQFLGAMPESLRRQVRLTWDWEIPGHDFPDFVAQVRRLRSLGVFGRSFYPNIRKRASIFYLALLGLRAGYKNIVLCGVDLSNNAYFYDSRCGEFEAKGRSVPLHRQAVAAPVHKTADPRYGELTITRAMQTLDREILQPAGVNLYVAFRSSGLHPDLPAYFER